uniref:Chloroplast terpenoid cyclase n=1 Tax=Catharanthus roseus TaxID=4058 RepID=D3K0Q1_CATRO|nr:chloroplast terpenoid cyclase [Catharanthus roseus]
MYKEQSNVLLEQVKMMLEEEMNPLSQLELIDDLQRLGIFYHFEDKIQSILTRIYMESSSKFMPNKKGLYETALEFRLLRQHHFHVPQEVFDCFRCDQLGDFKASLSEDTKGLLQLYEASFLLTENERTLELAREFTTKNLKKKLEKKKVIDPELVVLIEHAIELPLHWRMLRLEARWFIDIYEKRREMCPAILKLAKLDFNIVQASHQMDLQYALRWWKSTSFSERLKFSRDRLVEHFFWTVGIIFDPEYGYCRRMKTKVVALITTIDDIYDVYGTLDELELFTNAVERWDIKAVDSLPDYMKMCYLELYNSVNEMAYDSMKEQGVYIIPHLSKAVCFTSH